ncbi:MAG: ABC transporter permease [Alphaproteobacteria bacterium]|nr:ABC transporter permease [Alphaproteobacteria bacterium]
MNDFSRAFALALELIARRDEALIEIVLLSLRVSLTASVLAFVAGAPLGAVLAVSRFRGRTAVVVFVNALLGLPPVVVGLFVYLMLSRAGPMGWLGWLFTPAAMIAAQTIITLPIVIAYAHRLCEPLWIEYGDSLLVGGASRLRAVPVVLAMARAALITAFLAAFGRAIAEVGAIIIVGGNIRGYTRTMTTAIALETSRGDLALALGLGLILISLSLLISTMTVLLGRAFDR